MASTDLRKRRSRRAASALAAALAVLATPGHAEGLPPAGTGPLRLAQGPGEGAGAKAGDPASVAGAPPSLEEFAAQFGRSERILGGTPAKPGQWPSMVAIYGRSPDGRDSDGPFCGATVIARQWALTAAHCAWDMRKAAANGVTFFIREGTVNLTSGARHDVPVSQLIIHEKYIQEQEGSPNDVALLQLAEPASSPPQTLLASSQVDGMLAPGRSATVVGFGRTTSRSMSDKLLQVDVPVVSRQDCRRAWPSAAGQITQETFCAGAKKGKDSCSGDSGGPIFMPVPGGQAQVGVVSWGAKKCGSPGRPGVYASVGRFEGWIRARVPDAVFYDGRPQTGATAATDQAVEAISSGATTSEQPSALAQLSVDIQQGNQLKVGTLIDIRVLSSIDGTFALFNQDSDGRAYQIFPTPEMAGAQPGGINRISAGKPVMIPPPRLKDQGFRFRIKPPLGQNRLVAVVAPAGARVDDILSRHADGADFYDLDDVLKELDQAMRGIEVVRLPPERRAVAVRAYEIID